ncbi:ABC transporter permease [Salisediminibacterium halotolerans]|uniref:Simple sugar transport system permease protein n=1 Tax=Salisediminibacterium halotolerans TaxID=517425 RepID=A0A1H9TLQ1_9BACI|nr:MULTISPECIES: ABC transporter permease [Salisediminibacterium]RLJ72336.1 nucleoside ABC transporter membrane protein [Actinophytocola xinjiangensis]RPE85550.1 nucleoside ABC transporter membrane protein [Salisediminibacterium halotolerans]TWG33505.1 nucleoside ABC transporter membrane protein [Salisediminibacterium halotolerans]SER98066.1 simple sugar transport system permease protein [Salisediminibacterium haloalkalitolerans]GEL08952.1 ABC transporter permease [Salisediminibacterium haloto
MDLFLIILYTIVPAALISATPLLLTAMGGLFSERSGVVNIGLEGLMVFGAFSGILGTLFFESLGFGMLSPWLGILTAAIIGMIFSLFHAVASISLRADQIVSGVALNILAVGLGVYITREIFDAGQTPTISARLFRQDVPLLSEIPIIGDMFFSRVYPTTWVAFLLVIVVWFVVFKTPFGLRLRSVGEHPAAADTMGINVNRMRYIGVMLSGLFGGMGGAIYAITAAGSFSGGTITGQGFMALAVLIFGKWHPFGAFGAALFFGLAQALSISAQSIPGLQDVPQVFMLILPYVVTILALAGVVGRATPPKAMNTHYEKGSR